MRRRPAAKNGTKGGGKETSTGRGQTDRRKELSLITPYSGSRSIMVFESQEKRRKWKKELSLRSALLHCTNYPGGGGVLPWRTWGMQWRKIRQEKGKREIFDRSGRKKTRAQTLLVAHPY